MAVAGPAVVSPLKDKWNPAWSVYGWSEASATVNDTVCTSLVGTVDTPATAITSGGGGVSTPSSPRGMPMSSWPLTAFSFRTTAVATTSLNDAAASASVSTTGAGAGGGSTATVATAAGAADPPPAPPASAAAAAAAAAAWSFAFATAAGSTQVCTAVRFTWVSVPFSSATTTVYVAFMSGVTARTAGTYPALQLHAMPWHTESCWPPCPCPCPAAGAGASRLE